MEGCETQFRKVVARNVQDVFNNMSLSSRDKLEMISINIDGRNVKVLT
jgi:hypothetical protein